MPYRKNSPRNASCHSAAEESPAQQTPVLCVAKNHTTIYMYIKIPLRRGLGDLVSIFVNFSLPIYKYKTIHSKYPFATITPSLRSLRLDLQKNFLILNPCYQRVKKSIKKKNKKRL